MAIRQNISVKYLRILHLSKFTPVKILRYTVAGLFVLLSNILMSCTGSSGEQVFLRFAAAILLGFCGIRTIMELFEFVQRKLQYLQEVENYLEILLIVCTAIFTIEGLAAECFCVGSYSWQFGAMALFLGWIDLIVYLKKLPLTGIRINMLQTVGFTFLKLIYLPTILIIAFALPFYMMFSRVSKLYPPSYNNNIVLSCCMGLLNIGGGG